MLSATRVSKMISGVACAALVSMTFSVGAAESLAATARTNPAGLNISTHVANDGMMLRISGPEGLVYEREFQGGANPTVLLSELGDYAVDGSYSWELVLYPRVSDAVRAEMRQARAEDWQVVSAPQAAREFGTFRVIGGSIVHDGFAEPTAGGGLEAAVEAASTPTALVEAAQVFATDLIVQGSSCVGIDCDTSESFGFDTFRLKENNLRIHFDDTSASASFPGNDWRLTANDSGNGGANRFSIDDATANTSPLYIEAGAGNSALHIDSTGGNVGMGTSTPAVELHIADGDSPTLRLEQNGASGFTPQTWDLAGNETNFFVRDVTNSSKLPFKVLPGAGDDTLVLDAQGQVGIGVKNALAKLHIKVAAEEPILLLEDTSTTAGNQIAIQAKNAGGNVQTSWFADAGQANEVEWRQNFQTTQFTLSHEGNSGNELTLTETGDLMILGALTTAMSNLPDYVFEDDYNLMPLDQLASYIAENKHLPNIPSAKEVDSTGTMNLTELNRLLLEKVEELTLYTLSQQDHIEALTERLESLEGGE